MLANCPSSGDPPKPLSDAPPKSASSRPLPNMAYLIPPLSLAPSDLPFLPRPDSAAPKLPIARAPPKPAASPAAAPKLPPKPLPAAPPAKKVRVPAMYPASKPAKPAVKASAKSGPAPRGVVQNVVYNPSLLPPLAQQPLLPNTLLGAGESLVYPLKPQSAKRPFAGVSEASVCPSYVPIQPGFEYASPVQLARGGPALPSLVGSAYGVPPPLFPGRQVSLVPGYFSQPVNGKAVEFPAALYQTPAGFVGPVVALQNDGKLAVQGAPTKVAKAGVVPQNMQAAAAATTTTAAAAAAATQNGAMGAVGAMGTVGAMGAMGTVGTVGTVGSMGAMGTMGTMGTIGTIGTMGTIGSMGSVGTVGTVGSVGTVGTQVPTHGNRPIFIPTISADEEGKILPTN